MRTDVPQEGRFVSPDPIGASGDDLLSSFRYVLNAPTEYGDPLGLKQSYTLTTWWEDGDPGHLFGRALINSFENVVEETADIALSVLGFVGDKANTAAGHATGNPNDPHALEGLTATCLSSGIAQGRLVGAVGEALEYIRLVRSTGSAAAMAEATRAWRLADVFKRGEIIEGIRGANLPRNFPVIDRFANGGATSIKSMDLTLDTYKNASNVERALDDWVKLLGGWRGQPSPWAGARVPETSVSCRVLEVVVPGGTMTSEQLAVFNRVAQRARDVYGLVVRVVELGTK